MIPTRPISSASKTVWLLASCCITLLIFVIVRGPVDAGHLMAEPMDTGDPIVDLVTLVNQERWVNGQLPPLKHVAQLDQASNTHSTNMAQRDFFMHCDPDNGDLPWDRMADTDYTGYSYAAENIAAGQSTPAAALSDWMESAGHRANILSLNVWEIGGGYHFQSADQNNVRFDSNGDCVPDRADLGPYRHYWTNGFGRRFDVYPLVIDREVPVVEARTVSLYIYGPVGATAMRFSNDGVDWSAWEPYAAERVWDLSPGNGSKTVYSEVTHSAHTYTAEDDILLAAPAPSTPEVGIDGGTSAVTLSWLHVSPNVQYDVFCSAEDPYFDAGDPQVAHIGIDLLPPGNGAPMALVDDALSGQENYHYVVLATGPDGASVALSNRLARYSFALTGS